MRKSKVQMIPIAGKGVEPGCYNSSIYGFDLMDDRGEVFFTVYLDELVMAFRQRSIEAGTDDSTLDDRCKSYFYWMQRNIADVAARQEV